MREPPARRTERGTERIEAFSDGVFAIVITLLGQSESAKEALTGYAGVESVEEIKSESERPLIKLASTAGAWSII